MSYKSTFSAVLLGLALAVGSPASAADVYGVLQVVKGNVQIKSVKDGKLAKAKVGSKIFPKDTIVTGKDSRAKIVMVDKNVLNVSPNSKLEIENYEYAPEQGKKDVLLNVLYGKVRSKVEQKYDGKGAKFLVKTPTAVAGVRGTDFIASFNQETKSSGIVTFEGKVEFGQQGAGGAIENPVMVNPGQQSEAKGDSPPPPPTPVPPAQLAAMDTESKAETATGAPDPRAPASDEKRDEKKDGDKDDAKKEDGPDRNRGAGNDSKDPAKDRQGNGPGATAGGTPVAPGPGVGGDDSSDGDLEPAPGGTAPAGPAPIAGMPPAPAPPPPPPPPTAADLEFTYVPPAETGRDPASTEMRQEPPPQWTPSPLDPVAFIPIIIEQRDCQICNEAITGKTNLTIIINQ